MARARVLYVFVATVALAMAGCGGSDSPYEAAKPAAEASLTPAQTEAKVLEVLVNADALDGAEDKVVLKCAGCSLAMDGSSEHTTEVHGYTLHLCSDHCKKNIESNPTESLLAIQLPAL